MKSRAKFIAPLLVLLVLGWAATKIFAPGKPLDLFEGYVEGDLVQIGPIEGERLAQLDVQPGSRVEKGAPLFTMATPVLDQQRMEAQARVDQAQATLENLKEALNRPEQIAVFKATLERAKASLVLSQSDFDRQSALLPKGATTVAQRDQAKYALDRDKAGVAEAERQIDAALLPSRNQEILGAEAAILQANAQLHQIDVRIARQKVVRASRRRSFRMSISGPARWSPPPSRSWRCCRRKTENSASMCRSRNSRNFRSARKSKSPATIAPPASRRESSIFRNRPNSPRR